MKRIAYITLVLLMLFIVSCTPQQEEQTSNQDTYPNAHLLVQASELNNILDDESLFLIDARAEDPDTLIPGSVHFAAVSELIDSDHEISNYLIGPDQFESKMREIGLDQDDEVIIYDDGQHLAASRLFYALEYYGFSNASLLNGGIAAWLEEGFQIAVEPVQADAGNFTVEVQPSKFCDFETVVAASEDPDKIILDVRSEGEYTGDVKRAEKGGHIPNAIHLEWREVIESDGVPYFKSASEIRDIYASAGLTPDKEIIPHCQSNVRGSHAYFTLRLMGYDSVRPYEGSWAEYGNREESVVVQ